MSTKKESDIDFFYAALQDRMVKTGKKQAELITLTGIYSGRLSEIVTGKKKPGLKTQTKIAAALGYELVDFLALGRSIVEGEAPPLDPEVAGYLAKARQVLEGPKGAALKTVIESMHQK